MKPPSLPAFRRRQKVAAKLIRLWFDDLAKSAPATIHRRACWLLVNELYDRLCCRANSLSSAELQAWMRALLPRAVNRDSASRSRRRSRGEPARFRGGPLPETLNRAIQELYGGSIRVRSSEPKSSETPSPGARGMAAYRQPC